MDRPERRGAESLLSPYSQDILGFLSRSKATPVHSPHRRMHLLPLLIVASISAVYAFPIEEEEAPRSLSLMYAKRGRELFGKRSMPFELVAGGQKRGRELFGKRSGPPMSFTLQEKRKGRELFGKRSGSPPILSLEYDNESSSEEEQRLVDALAKNLRERRAKMSELLG